MYELAVSLNEQSNIPLFEQIYEYVKDEISMGRIPTGTRLPSTRALCAKLGISRSTAQLAYDQLVAEGFVVSIPCKGYYTADADTLKSLLGVGAKNGKSEACDYHNKSGKETTHYVADFSPRGIDEQSFPTGVWKKMAREVLSVENGELFLHGDPKGEPELREAIRGYLYEARGVNADSDQIIVGAGTDYLLMLLLLLLGGNRISAMEDPSYPRARRVLETGGNRVIPIAMDEQGMRVDLLTASNADLAYVMPSHQFPTGRVMPIRRRLELLSWADAEENRFLIEDDYDSEFRYRGLPLPSLQSRDRSGKVIYLGTFSRTVAPGIRVSYMVLPKSLLSRFHDRCDFFAATVSRIDQEILTRFLKDGHYERHLNRMRRVYRKKHDTMIESIKPLLEKFSVVGENAGTHLMLECGDASMSERDLVRLAEEQGVKIYGISGYAVGENSGRPAILLGFARLSEEEIRTGCRLLSKAFGYKS